MPIKLNTTGYPLTVITPFINMLQEKINHYEIPDEVTHITLKFTDPKYGERPGGFHPTDVQLEKQADATWRIATLCDYCNFSHSKHPHFAKDLEFDFNRQLYHNICGLFSDDEAKEHFSSWQTNMVFFIQEHKAYDTDIQMHWTPNIR